MSAWPPVPPDHPGSVPWRPYAVVVAEPQNEPMPSLGPNAKSGWVYYGDEHSAWQHRKPLPPGKEGFAYRQDLPATALALRPNTPVIDGVGDLEFKPRTLFLRPRLTGGRPGLFTPEIDPLTGNPDTVAPGAVTFEIEGLLEGGGNYIRRFQLPQDRTISMSIAAYRDIRVRILRSSAAGIGVAAVVTNREPTTTANQPPVYYSERYTTQAGLYRTPPGAEQMTPAVDDPGFEWVGNDAVAAQNILQPQLEGVTVVAAAGKFRPSVALFTATWRIRI